MAGKTGNRESVKYLVKTFGEEGLNRTLYQSVFSNNLSFFTWVKEECISKRCAWNIHFDGEILGAIIWSKNREMLKCALTDLVYERVKDWIMEEGDVRLIGEVDDCNTVEDYREMLEVMITPEGKRWAEEKIREIEANNVNGKDVMLLRPYTYRKQPGKTLLWDARHGFVLQAQVVEDECYYVVLGVAPSEKEGMRPLNGKEMETAASRGLRMGVD